jgi:uncharacterized metal-binding protein YceD (DUF177 family)
MSELTRMIDLREIGNAPVMVAATAAECAALAKRFALVAVDQLEALITLVPDGASVVASGTLTAEIVQSCAVSGDDLQVSIAEPVTFRFVPARTASTPDEEIELSEADLDEIEYSGNAFDLGEAVAQSLALAVDPFLEGPNAEEARRRAGLLEPNSSNPFAALLKK